jgi:hypothetical protein
MVAEVFAGVSALKTALDIAKTLKTLDDAVRRNSAVMELQEKILNAQEAQAALVERESELKKRVAELEHWEGEKERYELKEIHVGVLAYVLKPAMANSEPPHKICANCYQNARKSILQSNGGSAIEILFCHGCKSELRLRSAGATFGRAR